MDIAACLTRSCRLLLYNKSQRYVLSRQRRLDRHILTKGLRRFKQHTVSAICATWIERLSQKGIPDPEASVNLIVAHVHGKKMIHEVNTNAHLSPDLTRKINEMCMKRLERVPVQYIIGEWDFHDLTLEMRPPILIPRPETEELAAMIAEEWPSKGGDGRFLEIGCGTGAISLYILSQLKQLSCVAVDKSSTACDLTKANASKLFLHDRISVLHGDITERSTICALSALVSFDVLVSNPPYITSVEMDALQPEVAKYEDEIALHGGEDGLDIIKHILSVAYSLLKPEHGLLWLEVGLHHPEMIRKLVEQSPELRLSYLKSIKDFSGRERFCCLGVRK